MREVVVEFTDALSDARMVTGTRDLMIKHGHQLCCAAVFFVHTGHQVVSSGVEVGPSGSRGRVRGALRQAGGVDLGGLSSSRFGCGLCGFIIIINN